MKEILPDKQYQKLLEDLSRMYEQSVLYGEQQLSRAKVESFWRMGRRIIDQVQHGELNATYGKKVIRQISADMTEKFGRGMGLRTINYMRSFASNYTRQEIEAPVTWSHYKILLSVSDDATRKRLTRRVIEEGLTHNELVQLVHSIRPSEDAGQSEFPLVPREATPGIYKIVIDGKSKQLLLDLGFGVLRQEPVKGLRNLQDGQHVRLTNKGQNVFERIDCPVGYRYCYQGTLLKVIDGDTVKMRMHLGFHNYIDENMRLRGVDAMELGTPEGDNAKAALARMLKPARTIHVFTYSYDRFGRYIADLLVDDQKYINKLLVENGHARFLNMSLRNSAIAPT